MNYQEMEEFFYTDLEVQREMEDARRVRVCESRGRRNSLAAWETAAASMGEERGGVEDYPGATLAVSIPWPVLAQERSGKPRPIAAGMMTMGELGMAG